MRRYRKLPAGFNERIEGFAPEFMAIFLSILIVIFTPADPWIRFSSVFFTYYLFTSFLTFFSPGQSIGKKMAKTEVLTIDYQLPSRRIMHLRDLFKWSAGFLTVGLYFVVAFIVFSRHPEKRTLHDFIFKTRVVMKEDLITS